MNNGAFGENFPYTNFHDLNLDWILKVIKKFEDNYSSITKQAEEAKEEIETAKDTAISQIERAIHLEDRRIIILGDSYGTRTYSGNTYADMIKSYLGLSDTQFYFQAVGGASFSNSSENLNYTGVLSNMNIPESETITDIYVQCGANDNFYSFSEVLAGVSAFGDYCKANYPRANVWLFACGLTISSEALLSRKSTMIAFKEGSIDKVALIENSDTVLMNSTLLETDRCHPNGDGLRWLAWNFCHAIMTGYCYDNEYTLTTAQLSPECTIDDMAVSIISYASGRLGVYRHNGILEVTSLPFLDIGMNAYNVEFSSANYIHVTMDNCVGLPSRQIEYPCYITTQDGKMYPATFQYKSKLEGGTIVYDLVIRPRCAFALGENQSHLYVYILGTLID